MLREHKRGRRRERGDRGSEVDSALIAVSLVWAFNSQTVNHELSRSRMLHHPGALHLHTLLFFMTSFTAKLPYSQLAVWQKCLQ